MASAGLLAGAETARSIRPSQEFSGKQAIMALIVTAWMLAQILAGGMLGSGLLSCLIGGGNDELLPGLTLVALLIAAVNLTLAGRSYYLSVAEVGRLRMSDIG
jgi:hypothetical protein